MINIMVWYNAMNPIYFGLKITNMALVLIIGFADIGRTKTNNLSLSPEYVV